MSEREALVRRWGVTPRQEATHRRLLAEGLCAGRDGDRWFPAVARPVDVSSARARSAEREARQACAGCPVMEMCRDWAVVTGQEYGIWGGLAEHELAELRRERRLALRRAARRRAANRRALSSVGMAAGPEQVRAGFDQGWKAAARERAGRPGSGPDGQGAA